MRSRIELGADAYSKGSIGYELVEALCDTLREFAQIMKEYRVDAYEAYASAVLRDVDNELFILDQIRLRTGLTVHVLSNSEHRFISYKSVAMREEFEHFIGRSAAVVDVSGSGLQITVFSKGKVLTTQHLGLGTMRMREQLAKKSRNLAQYELQIEEMVVKEMEVFKAMYLENQEIEYLIVIGDYIAELVCRLEKNHNKNTVSIEKFVQYMEQLGRKSLEEIAEELGLSNENDPLIVPYIIICKCMARGLGAKELWAPGVIVSDGIACDYAQKNRIYKPTHDFDEDIISAAESLSRRYMSYSPHIEALTQMAMLLFDTMKNSTVSERESGCCCRSRRFCMTAENISALPMPRSAHTTSSCPRKLWDCRIWSVRSLRGQCSTTAIRLPIMRMWRTGSTSRVFLRWQSYPPFCAFPMRWIAATNRSLKT